MQDLNHNPIIKAAIYARVSSDEQKKGKTIDPQILELKNFANENNYEIVKIYKDNPFSGAVLERPKLDLLRDDADKGLFDVVLVNDVDRLSREMLHLGIIKRDLERKNIKLIFRKLPDQGNPFSNFMINVLGSFAQFERQMIADRTRRGKRYKVEVKNLILGNIPPYGYDYVKKVEKNDGYYTINKKEARIVKKMFKWVVEGGASQREVNRRLAAQKIPARKSLIWRNSSVHRVLTNSTYTGITFWNKYKSVESMNHNGQTKHKKYKKRQKSSTTLRPKSEWIPINLPDNLKIIDEKIFNAAQKQFQKNKCFSKRNTKNSYLLRGMVRCGLCKSPYLGNPCHDKLFYRCGNRATVFPAPKKCNAGMISAPKLENLVWKNVENAIQNPKIILDQTKKFEEKQQREPAEIEVEINNIKKELADLKTEEDRLFNAYRKSVITLERFQAEIEKLNHERDPLNSDLKKLENRITSQSLKKSVITRSVKDYSHVFGKRISQFTFTQKQIFLRFLLDKVIIEKNKIRIRGIIPAYAKPEEGIKNLIKFSDLLDKIGITTFAGDMRLVHSYSNIALTTL